MNGIKLIGWSLFCTVMGIFIGERDTTPKKDCCLALQNDITMLQETKDLLINAYVPDSLRGTIHQTEAYIKTCAPCMYIDSLLQAKEQELKEAQD